MTRPIAISLDFLPAFFHKHLGVRFGEAYYFDPGHRAAVEREKAWFLHAVFGRYGVGNLDPDPPADLFIQSVDLILRTQGAAWRFPDDATVESWGAPWAGRDPGEIARLDPREAAQHPIVEALLAQYREMARTHGERADLLGMKSGVLNVHAPFTIAHQLCGEELFILMAEEPAAAHRIFANVWEIVQAVYGRVAQATGARPTHLQLGDCSASLLSAATYRAVVLPVNRAILRAFASAGYHSCGSSSHLLDDFGALGTLANIQLGPGTDIAAAARWLPGTRLEPLVDPVLMREGDSEAVSAQIAGVLRAAAPAPAVTLCAWSFDRDTPLDNVAALYQTAERTTA